MFNHGMASAVSLAHWYPASDLEDGSPCAVSFGDVQRQPELHRRLSRMLEGCLFEPPNPRLSWLNQVDLRESRALARFEPGHGTLGQQAQVGTRGVRPLPLPFLWSLRTINAVVAVDPPHGLSKFSPHAVLTIGGGEARLNAALIDSGAEPRRGVEVAPQCLVRTLASCIGACDPARPLSLHRPILPAGVLQAIAGLPARIRGATTWRLERDALRALELRLQGRFFVTPEITPCRASDLVRRQLGLLGALAKLEGNAAVERYFEANGERFQTQPDFRTALGAWCGEGKLYPWDAQSRTRHDAQRERRVATETRIAQARLEFRRRDRTVALALAVDAVCAAPESPEAWLLLGEMRICEARGSAALCFSEAICAARGGGETIALVQEQLRLSSEAELAAYFRTHGDFALAEWLDPGQRRRVTPLTAIRH